MTGDLPVSAKKSQSYRALTGSSSAYRVEDKRRWVHGSLSVKSWGLETNMPQSEGSLETGQSIVEGGGASQVALVVRNPPANARDMGSVPESGRSLGGGHGNPLQHSCLENPMDRRLWQPTVYGVAKSWT